MEVQLNTKLFTDTHEVRPGVIIGISTNQKKPTWYLVKLNDRCNFGDQFQYQPRNYLS